MIRSRNSGKSAYAENSETLDLEQLVWIAGIGNLIGAGLGHLPKDFMKKVFLADLLKIHNTARPGSNIRRLVRKELLNRDFPFYVWHDLYLLRAKRGTLLRKMAAVRMLEKSTDDFEYQIAYGAIEDVAPELRTPAAEKILERISDPKILRNIIAREKYPILSHMARMKLYKLFTL